MLGEVPTPRPLHSRRLILTPATAELVRLEIEDPRRLGAALGVHVPHEWPPEMVRDALPLFAERLASDPREAGWTVWYWCARDDAGGRPQSPAERGF